MAAKLTRLTHKIRIQLHLVAESCAICCSYSRWPGQSGNFWIHRRTALTLSIVIIIIIISQVSFPLVLLLLNQWPILPLRLQVSNCSTIIIIIIIIIIIVVVVVVYCRSIHSVCKNVGYEKILL
jgi:hypothetical protein